MDHIQRNTDSNPIADEETLSTFSKQEGDLEWKMFIQKELEKLENQEKDEGKEDSEKTTSAETKFNLNSLIEQIPLEKMIDSAIQFINKKIDSEKTEPETTKSKKMKSKKIESEKENRKEEEDQRFAEKNYNDKEEFLRRVLKDQYDNLKEQRVGLNELNDFEKDGAVKDTKLNKIVKIARIIDTLNKLQSNTDMESMMKKLNRK